MYDDVLTNMSGVYIHQNVPLFVDAWTDVLTNVVI